MPSYMQLLDVEHGQSTDTQWVYVVGHLGQDAKTYVTKTGRQLTRSRIAVNKPNGPSEWFSLVWWNNAEAQELVTGQFIRLVGPYNESEYKGEKQKEITVRMHYAYKPKAKAAPPSDLPPEPGIPF